MYKIQWIGNYGKPTPAFWADWRADREAMKEKGYRVFKDKGQWTVRRGVRDGYELTPEAAESLAKGEPIIERF